MQEMWSFPVYVSFTSSIPEPERTWQDLHGNEWNANRNPKRRYLCEAGVKFSTYQNIRIKTVMCDVFFFFLLHTKDMPRVMCFGKSKNQIDIEIM